MSDPGWVEQHLGLSTTAAPDAAVPLGDLVRFALRRNPRRAHLLVSTVLGKHLPAPPATVHGAGLLLGELVAGQLGDRPAAVLGFAETATGLGHCVAEALGAYYLHYPAAFALLPGSVEMALSYWRFILQFGQRYGLRSQTSMDEIGHDGDQDDTVTFEERFALKGLLILRTCSRIAFHPITTISYQQKIDKEEKRLASELLREGIFDVDSAREMTAALMTKFFVFTRRDLKQWEEEPDEWEKTQEGAGDDWEFSIRTCAEKLFLDLVINLKDPMVPFLINILQQHGGLSNSGDILTKDSVYAAIGLAAPILEGHFDFATFLSTNLIPDLQLRVSGSNILRRRIAIMLGQWVPVHAGLDNDLVYGIFLHLLDKSDPLNDQVVRVTAGRQLFEAVNPHDFQTKQFSRLASRIVRALMPLVEEVELTETKLALLNTLSLIVVNLELYVSPLAQQILDFLQAAWSSADKDHILKQSILGTLSRLVMSLQGQSSTYHSLLVPVVRQSIGSYTGAYTGVRQYLLEDGLDLWESLVEQSTSPPSAELASLIDNLLPLFDSGSEALRKALEITEGYVYLMPAQILASPSLLLAPLANLLNDSKKEIVGIVTHLVELLLQSAQSIGGPGDVQVLATHMLESFLPPLLIALKECYDANQTTGPNAIQPPIDGIVETYYWNVMARIGVASPEVLVVSVRAALREQSMDWLIKEWFAHMDNISSPEEKKLSAMALTGLLDDAPEHILPYLQSYMSMWTDVVNEVVYETEDPATHELVKVDCYVHNSSTDDQPDEAGCPGASRRGQLRLADPVHRIDIRDLIREKLESVIGRSGGLEAFQERWIKTLDQDVVRAFSELGIL